MCTLIAMALIALLASDASAAEVNAPAPPRPPDPDSSRAVVQSFERRVRLYQELSERCERRLPREAGAGGVETVRARQKAMAELIRAERRDAVRGDLFRAPIEQLIRGIVRDELSGPDGAASRASIGEETQELRLEVNQEYPDAVPLPTVPPRLLRRLPQLPRGLEYRFVGSGLLLRDVKANLIVDSIDGLLP